MRIVVKQPPPNFLAPYPAIKALNHPGIIIIYKAKSKNYAITSNLNFDPEWCKLLHSNNYISCILNSDTSLIILNHIEQLIQ